MTTANHSTSVVIDSPAPAGPCFDLYVCHHQGDGEWAQEVARQVEQHRSGTTPLRVNLDPWDLEVGENRVAKINRGLAESRFVAIALSPEMIASEWGALQISAALARTPHMPRPIRLFSILVSSYSRSGDRRLEIPPTLRSLPILDFRTPDVARRSVRRLVALLREGDASAVPSFARGKALPPPPQRRPEDADAVVERLVANVLQVTTIPRVVWEAQTSLRSKRDLPGRVTYPAFVLQPPRLFSLQHPGSGREPLTEFLTSSSYVQHSVPEWVRDPLHWGWFVELLKESLRRELRPRGVLSDYDTYFVAPVGNGATWARWVSGHDRKVVTPRVARLEGAWAHEAAELTFQRFGELIALCIAPRWIFTRDGRQVIGGSRGAELLRKWMVPERNRSLLGRTLLWADAICQGRRECVIGAGTQQLVIQRDPVRVDTARGLADDTTVISALESIESARRGEGGEHAFRFVDEAEHEAQESDDDETADETSAE